MKFEIKASPIFWFVLTPDQIRVLMYLSERHYDANCRSASKVGGFMFGWNNSVVWAAKENEESKCRATFHDLDITCKILEMASMLKYDERKIANALSLDFKKAMSAANERIHSICTIVE